MAAKKSDNLRKRAEEKLEFMNVDLSKMSEDDIRKVFQELHTHRKAVL